MTDQGIPAKSPLLLIHPVGVGLSARFWDRFINHWKETSDERELIAPDLQSASHFDLRQRSMSEAATDTR